MFGPKAKQAKELLSYRDLPCTARKWKKITWSLCHRVSKLANIKWYLLSGKLKAGKCFWEGKANESDCHKMAEDL